MKHAVLIALALTVATPAEAAPLDLRLRPPTRLRMRVAQPTPAPAPAAASRDSGAPPDVAVRGDTIVVRRRDADAAALPPLADRLILRVDIGLAVDGSRVSNLPSIDGQQPAKATYQSVRSYGFGELYLGSRGIGAPSLSTYLSSQLRVATDPFGATPIMSPYERASDFQTRAAWIESDGLFTSRLLAPIRVRAGRMFLYGPAIIHLDGLVVAWEKGWFEISTFGGARVPAYRTLDADDVGGEDLRRGDGVTGSEVRADLRRFSVPVVLTASTLRYLEQDHSELAATWVPRKTIVVRSSSRFHDGRLARQRLVIRARVSEDSTVILDNQLRTKNDWFWDYASISVTPAEGAASSGEPDFAARRYLDLGPVRPRFQSSVQAGTVIAQNVDVLARGAVALDVERDSIASNPHLPDYVEGGAAIEVRLRRALNVQVSALVRDYSRPLPDRPLDQMGALPVPDVAEQGEESLVEGGMSARYSAGARRFSAQGELYYRRTRWVPLYEDRNGNEIELTDTHGGGRFSLEAWVSPQIRLRGEYDISSLVDHWREFRGLKTLRLLVEGTY